MSTPSGEELPSFFLFPFRFPPYLPYNHRSPFFIPPCRDFPHSLLLQLDHNPLLVVISDPAHHVPLPIHPDALPRPEITGSHRIHACEHRRATPLLLSLRRLVPHEHHA